MNFLVMETQDGAFFATCLEHYVAAQGRTVNETLKRLLCAYQADYDESLRRTGEAFGSIAAAPSQYRQAYDEGRYVLQGMISQDGISGCYEPEAKTEEA